VNNIEDTPETANKHLFSFDYNWPFF